VRTKHGEAGVARGSTNAMLIRLMRCFLARQDEAYADAGARVAGAKEALGSDVVLKVQPPSLAEVEQLKEHARCVCSVWRGK